MEYFQILLAAGMLQVLQTVYDRQIIHSLRCLNGITHSRMVVNHCETILIADGMQASLNEDSVRHAGASCSDRPKMAEVIAEIKFLLLFHPQNMKITFSFYLL
jgi:hypothetical protein